MAKRRVKHINCPNCSYSFNGIDNYCPNCGQENHTHKLPVKHFIIEAIEGYFHFDTKIVNTLRDLIFKPGTITKNYNNGKRVRYVSPIRFYILVSFVLFLLLSFQNSENEEGSSSSSRNATSFSFTVESIDKFVKDGDLKRLALYKELDNGVIDNYLDSVGIKTNWYNKAFIHNYIKVKTGHITATELRHKIRKTFSTIMFFLMPIFAFYLFLFHYRLKLYYSEHLVFSIHLHSMAFLVIIVWLLCKSFLSEDWYFLVFVPIILVHLAWATKIVYGQRIGVVIGKLILITLLYIITLVVFFILTIVLSLI